MFCNRSQRQCRKEIERAEQNDNTYQQTDEDWGMGRQGAGANGDRLFARQRTRQCQQRQIGPIAAEEHDDPGDDVVKGRITAQSTKGAAIIVGGTGNGIEDLAETMRPRIKGPGPSGARTHGHFE